jgi:hypothetical protein
MRVKREYRSGSRQAYDSFCARHPLIQISFEKWKQILVTANTMFISHALETGDPVKLPYGFSVLAIHRWQLKTFKLNPVTGEKIITLPIDWKKTKEEGHKVYNFNFHTSGYGYKWKWFPKMARINEPSVWVFRPARAVSRAITKYVRNGFYAQLYKEYQRGNVKMYIG